MLQGVDGPDGDFLSCAPVQDTQVENNTCVLSTLQQQGRTFRIPDQSDLAPEVTEGPYYHNVGHPIRQNIAEYQDGLLLVCLFSPAVTIS